MSPRGPTPMNLELREATAAERTGWDDLLRKFPQPRVEHTFAWIESLAAVGSGRPLFLVWTVDGEVVGCLPGLLTKVGPLTLFGSPLPGWQTGGMGPLFDPARVTTSQLIGALLPALEERYGVDHIEMLCGSLDSDAMAQLGFRGESVPTYRAPLYPGDETRQLKALKDSARRNLKRAQRLGIQVKFVDDDTFVELHYAQLRDVYVRGGNAIPFGIDRVRETFRHARDAGRLIAVTASLADGATVIASGIFATEGKELLLWSWAHSTRYRWYRATELLTWAVMTRALERGCETFDFMGLGDFKAKFGATLDHSKTRWVRSRTPALTRLRDTAARLYGWQQALRGRLSRALPRVFSKGDEEGRAVALVMGGGDEAITRTLGLARIPVVTRLSPDEPVDDLLRCGWAQPEPPALFYSSESQLAFVTRHRERLSQAFRFVVPAASRALPVTAADADAPVESYHVYVDEQGKIAGEFTGRQIGTALETTHDADVQNTGRSIVQKVKLRGVASIDFQRGPDGSLRLLRVAPWFTGWHQLGARAGVNLPALVYADLVGSDRPAPAVARAGVRASGPPHDLLPSPRAERPPVPARSVATPQSVDA